MQGLNMVYLLGNLAIVSGACMNKIATPTLRPFRHSVVFLMR